MHLRVGPVALPGRRGQSTTTPMGHEYVGVVEEIGDEVTTLKVGDFVVGSFVISDNTCEICQAGYQSKLRARRVRRRHRSAPRPRRPASPTPTAPWSPHPASPTKI